MAKKNRRARRPLTSTSFSPAPSPVTSEVTRPAPGASPIPGKKVDFATEYYYVVHDLRNMGIIAATMLTILVALSFILR